MAKSSRVWRNSLASRARLVLGRRALLSDCRSPRRQRCARSRVRSSRHAERGVLRRHVDALRRATAKRAFVRINELVEAAARQFPGLVPTPQDIAAEEGLRQSQKAGLEIDQGLFISAMLRSKQVGPHLCHAMLLPKPRGARRCCRSSPRTAASNCPARRSSGAARRAIVTFRNPRFLNAEDQTTLDGMETCVDLALLDEQIEVAVLRGMKVEHPKYKDRHVFGAGINLTHLYHGRIPFLWYLERDLGYVNKLYRGLALARRRAARRVRRPDHREAVDRGGGSLRHRRPLPDPARGRLRAGREDRVPDAAGAQGGHHPRRRQHAAAALRSATASPGRRSSTSGGSNATARRGG